MSSRQTVFAFVDSINAHDLAALADLMSDDHKFIDAHGNEVVGREQMLSGWRGYFDWFPDYNIEVDEVIEGTTSDSGQVFALFGCAGASFKGDADRSWRLPAAWKAVVTDGRVTLWQVFADTKIPFEIIERS